jgi:flavin-dependent dehydrogenase
MSGSYDVAIVGARCAGAPLAALLARAGVSVVVLEATTELRDTPSTHLFEADGLNFVDRLGVIDELKAAGAPLMNRADMRLGDERFEVSWPLRSGDVAGMTSVRRHVLDPILAGAARAAGAEVRMGARVTDLVRDRDRVIGVRVGDDEIRARLVVGADGRSSTIAKLAGARRYNVVPNERIAYWAYFEGADLAPVFSFHRWETRAAVASPTDGGLYCAQVMPERSEVGAFKADLEGSFMAHVRSHAPAAAAIEGARRVGKIQGQVRWDGFFRDARGPGWVLTGDAGHFKDPAPGRGIADAFMQADYLAAGLAKGDFDAATADFAKWRDKEFAEYYWFGCDQGAAGPIPLVVPEFIRGLKNKSDILEITNHRLKPTQVLKPPRILAAAGRALRKGQRRRVIREFTEQAKAETERRRLNRRPRYEP